jgi:hypothetical protein
VRADQDLIFLEMTMTPPSAADPSAADPSAADPASADPASGARASLSSLAAVVQAGADIGLRGRRWRVRMEIPRRPDHQSGLR